MTLFDDLCYFSEKEKGSMVAPRTTANIGSLNIKPGRYLSTLYSSINVRNIRFKALEIEKVIINIRLRALCSNYVKGNSLNWFNIIIYGFNVKIWSYFYDNFNWRHFHYTIHLMEIFWKIWNEDIWWERILHADIIIKNNHNKYRWIGTHFK